MPWVRFIAAFNYAVRRNVAIAYKPGAFLVKADCAEQAIRSGKAVAIERPNAKADDPRRPSAPIPPEN
jgi:hypothetical protein